MEIVTLWVPKPDVCAISRLPGRNPGAFFALWSYRCFCDCAVVVRCELTGSIDIEQLQRGKFDW